MAYRKCIISTLIYRKILVLDMEYTATGLSIAQYSFRLCYIAAACWHCSCRPTVTGCQSSHIHKLSCWLNITFVSTINDMKLPRSIVMILLYNYRVINWVNDFEQQSMCSNQLQIVRPTLPKMRVRQVNSSLWAGHFTLTPPQRKFTDDVEYCRRSSVLNMHLFAVTFIAATQCECRMQMRSENANLNLDTFCLVVKTNKNLMR